MEELPASTRMRLQQYYDSMHAVMDGRHSWARIMEEGLVQMTTKDAHSIAEKLATWQLFACW